MENNTGKKRAGRKPVNDYTAVEMKREYVGYKGDLLYCIFTRMSKEELLQKYEAKLKKYQPYIIVAGEDMYEARADFVRNNDNYRQNAIKHHDFFAFEEGTSELYHSELSTPDIANDVVFKESCCQLKVAFAELTPVQLRRVIARFYEGKSSRAIAKEEGVNYSKVDNSINAALEKMRKYFA